MGSRGNGSQNLNSIEILVESWKLMQKLKKTVSEEIHISDKSIKFTDFSPSVSNFKATVTELRLNFWVVFPLLLKVGFFTMR